MRMQVLPTCKLDVLKCVFSFLKIVGFKNIFLDEYSFIFNENAEPLTPIFLYFISLALSLSH
jgi:hypothetical protein